jgi:hypothetical protein
VRRNLVRLGPVSRWGGPLPSGPGLQVQRPEPVGVEVPGHIPHPVLAGERHPRDRGHVHALGREQHHLRPPPSHHRPAAPADDPRQPPPLIIIDLSYPQTISHRASLREEHSEGKLTGANLICYGTSHVAGTAGLSGQQTFPHWADRSQVPVSGQPPLDPTGTCAAKWANT